MLSAPWSENLTHFKKCLVAFAPQKQNPRLREQTGVSEFNLDDDLLSHGETPHYHRRCIVSLLSSGWDQVVPMLYGRQEILWPDPPLEGVSAKSGTSTKTKPLPACADRGFGI